ncbi:MAG TPA: Rne/Rng family ribonuclease [Planctomycetota bacterium]|nr:Rne/Rng family ribonuclease [Planctomycetota bacterium]
MAGAPHQEIAPPVQPAPGPPLTPDDWEADEIAARRAGQIVENILQNQNRGFVPPPKPLYQNHGGGGGGGGGRRRKRRRGRDRDRDRGQQYGMQHGGGQGPKQGFPPRQGGERYPQRPNVPNAPHGGAPKYTPDPKMLRDKPAVAPAATVASIHAAVQSAPAPASFVAPVAPVLQKPIVEAAPSPIVPPAAVAPEIPAAPVPVADEPASNYADAMADESTGIYEPTTAPVEGEAIAAAPLAPQQPRFQKLSRNWRESTYESSSVAPQQAPSNIRKVVLLNSTEPGEIRVAILENGELAEIFMERKSHYHQAGNIYKGRVVNVEPSLQAAFIDLGSERNGFLHASDVIPPDGGYGDILEKKPFDKNRGKQEQRNEPRPQNEARQQHELRPQHEPRSHGSGPRGQGSGQRERGATPPSVIAAQQAAQQGAAQALKPPSSQFAMGADGPLLLNRPARPTPRPDYRAPHAPQSFQAADEPVAAAQTPSSYGEPLALNAPALPATPAAPVEVPPLSEGGSDIEPMPIVPGQPYPMQGAAPFVPPQPQGGGFQNRDGKRRRRRRGGRGRANRARPPGAAPMLAPNRNLMPHPGQPGSTQPVHPVVAPSVDPSAPTAVEPGTEEKFPRDPDAPPVAADAQTSASESGAQETRPTSGTSDADATPSAPAQSVDENDDFEDDDSFEDDDRAETGAPQSGAVTSETETEATQADANRPRDEMVERMDRADELADQLEEDDAHQPPTTPDASESGPVAQTRSHDAVEVSDEARAQLDSDSTATASISDIVTRSFEPVAPVAVPPVSGTETVGAETAPPVVQPVAPQQRKFGNGRKERVYDRRYTIQEMLREGQEVLVQVAKEGIGQKGPALTTYISLPGRYLVLMPAVSRLGVSKRIDSEEQRRALKDALNQLNPPDEMGVIVRTAGMGRSKDELQRDMEYLMRAWNGLKDKTKTTKTPALIYQEGDVVTRVFRDVLTEDVTEIIIDDPIVMERAREFLRETSPGSEKKLKLYSDAEPLFHRYNVEQQMQRLFNRKVNLKNRGSIVIEQTEALVAIDVNTGGFREKRNQDDTILQTNLEAAREIARQLRLRDIGGLVMIDFIDMEIYEHRRRVERELKAHLARDKAKINVLPVSSLGVVEMTRQRIRHSLRKTLFDRCPHCSGSGHVKSPESVGLEMLREIKAQLRDKTVRRVKVLLNAIVAYAILNQFRKELVRMEEANGITIEVCGDPGVSLSQMQVSIAKEGGEWILKKVSEVDDYVRNS